MIPLTGKNIVEADKIRTRVVNKVTQRLPRIAKNLSDVIENDDGTRDLSKIKLRLAAYNELISRMESIANSFWWTTIGNKRIDTSNDLRMFAADVFAQFDDKNSWVGAFDQNLF